MNETPLGAQAGRWYVPSASLVRPVPSGRTSQRSVSLPRRISSWLDQLGSPKGSVAVVLPPTSAMTTPCAVEYMSPVASGDQPRSWAPARPSTMPFPVAISNTYRDWSCVYARGAPSGANDLETIDLPGGNEAGLSGRSVPSA